MNQVHPNDYKTVNTSREDQEESPLYSDQSPSIISMEIWPTPIKNFQTWDIMQQAKRKLAGVTYFLTVKKDMIRYGSTALIFDQRKGSLKKNALRILQKRSRVLSQIQKEPSAPNYGCLFTPESKFKNYWSLVILFYLMYVFTGMPYVLAFEEVEIGSNIFFFELSMDIVFFIDILITMNSAYINPSTGQIIVDRFKIFWNYLTGMLLIDILAIFPFYLITNSESGRSNSFVRFIRITKLSRIFRGSKILGVLKNFTHSPRMQKVVRFVRTYDGITRLATLLYIIFLMAHFTACMWYFVAKIQGIGPDSWVVRNNLQDESNGRIYLAGFYFSFAILTTVGFGDIHAYTVGEMMLCILWMMFGIGFYSFVIGTLTSVLATMDAKNSALKQIINKVDDFSDQFILAEEINKEMKKVIKNGGRIGNMEDQERIWMVNMMPKVLRYKIAFNLYDRAASHILFFRNQDQVFVSFIVPRLNYKLVMDQTILYSINDYADEMFFIVQGCVDFIIGEQNTPFKRMHEGSHFGEIELISKTNRSFSTMCCGDCKLLVMDVLVFNQIQKQFPKVYEQIISLAEKKQARIQQNMKEVNQLLRKHRSGTQGPQNVERTESKQFGNNVADNFFSEFEELRGLMDQIKGRLLAFKDRIIYEEMKKE